MELVRQEAQLTVNGEAKYSGASKNRPGDHVELTFPQLGSVAVSFPA